MFPEFYAQRDIEYACLHSAGGAGTQLKTCPFSCFADKANSEMNAFNNNRNLTVVPKAKMNYPCA
jgi:hypothetical protein